MEKQVKTSNTGTCEKAKETSADDDVSDDLYEAARLRFLFQRNTTVGSLWSTLREIGWTYHPGRGGYEAPKDSGGKSGLIFTSTDIFPKFDEGCIKPIDNYLQLPPVDEGVVIADEWSRSLRYQVIKAMGIETIEKYTEIMTDDNDMLHQIKESKTRAKIRRPKRIRTALNSAAPEKKRKNEQQTSMKKTNFLFPLPQEIFETIEWKEADDEKNFTKHYSEWKFLLSTRHSLLFYGFGSKRYLLNDFSNEALSPEGDVLQIDGFDRTVTLESLLNLIVKLFLQGKEPTLPQQQQQYIEERYANYKPKRFGIYYPTSTFSENIDIQRAAAIGWAISEIQIRKKYPLYLIVHNIDGFRDRNIQKVLATLLLYSIIFVQGSDEVQTIRLVASIDHVNSGALLWDPETLSNFAFIWKEVNTYHPYKEELKRGIQKMKDKGGKHTIKKTAFFTSDSIRDILYTITPFHTEVLQILVKLQLQQAKINKEVDYKLFLDECMGKLVVYRDERLREYMTELLDHNLIERRVENGAEFFTVPHNDECIQTIINFENKR